MDDTTIVPEQTPQRHYSFERGSSAKKKRVLFLLLFLLLVGGLVFGASRFLGQSSEKKEAQTSPTPTEFIFPTDTPTPTEDATKPTPTPTKAAATPTVTPRPSSNPVDKTTGLDRSSLSVQILNGSGVAGAAKKASDFLSGLGYSIASTGNADAEDFQGVTIKVKSSKSSFLPLLKKDLEGSYTVSSSTSDLSASSSADALVIVGK